MVRQLYPIVSADVALFSMADDRLQVLLVRREQEPAAGRWALPGAILQPQHDKDLEATALRALREKISVEVPYLEQLRTFAGSDRDPRGWSLSVLHYALLPQDRVHAVVRSSVDKVMWSDADAPGPPLAFDHAAQVMCARSVLRQRVRDHALPLHLMPARFTLTQLQRVCEAILSPSPAQPCHLDKGAFRRRFARSPDIVEVHGAFEHGAQRPAQLFSVAEGFRF